MRTPTTDQADTGRLTAAVIHPDGTDPETVTVSADALIADVSRLIGDAHVTRIAAVIGGRAVWLYADEDGHAKRLAPNPAATHIAQTCAHGFRGDDFLCGTVLVIGRKGHADTALPSVVLAWLHRTFVEPF